MKTLNRIKNNREFARAIHKGNSSRLPSFVVHVFKTELGYTRIGISASTKLGCAVVRNRVKRQVRAICDSLIDYNAKSLDIVIIVRSKFITTDFEDNKSQLRDLLKQY
jgi:ribonuclease P protein component